MKKKDLPPTVEAAVEIFTERVRNREAELDREKRNINAVAKSCNLPPPFPDVEIVFNLRRDEFFGLTSPSAAAQAYLSLRGPFRGSADVETIHKGLIHGSFTFDTAKDEVHALRIAMGKNPSIIRLPNDTYGLAVWYPEQAKRILKAAAVFNGDSDERIGDYEGPEENRGEQDES